MTNDDYLFYSDQNSSFDLTDSEDIDADDLSSELPNLPNPLFIQLDTPMNTNLNSSVNQFELSESPPGDPPSTPPTVPPDKQLGSPPNILSCDSQLSTSNLNSESISCDNFGVNSHKAISLQDTTIYQPNFQIPQQTNSFIYGTHVYSAKQDFGQNNFPFHAPCQFQYFPQNISYNLMPSFYCRSCILLGTLSICNQITSANDMKAYLQRKITGNSSTRFNKKTLHYLYEIFAQRYHWGPLTRTEKRNKMHVFKKLFDNKLLVIDYIQKCPSIIDQVLLKTQLKILNSKI